MTNVWVVQEQPNLDYTKAEAWGEVRFLTGREYRPLSNSPLNEQIKWTVQNQIDTVFDPEHDLVVLTGNPIIIGWAVHRLLHRLGKEGYEYLRILQHDKHIGGYREARLWTQANIEA